MKKWKICKFFLILNGQALITKTQIFSTTNFASQAQVGVFIGKEYIVYDHKCTSACLKEVLNYYPPSAD